MKTLDLAHFFYPKDTNNFRARVLHVPSLVTLILLIILLQSILHLFRVAGIKVLGYAANISAEQVIKLTNTKRAEFGFSPLEHNPFLSEAALAKGTDMLNRDYWAHIAPDGTEPWKFFIDAGYKYRYAGENLARDFPNTASAIDAWMASPTHKENILSPKYKEVGIAVVEGDLNGVETTIIVQLFGTPSIDSIPSLPVALAQSPEASPPPPAVASGETHSEVVARISSAKTPVKVPVFSPFTTTRVISLGIVALLSMVLIVDALVIARKGVTRISGKPFAHISFLGMILAIILIMKSGQIL